MKYFPQNVRKIKTLLFTHQKQNSKMSSTLKNIKWFIVLITKMIQKIHKIFPYKNSHVGPTLALSIYMLTCINIYSHVTSYMIVAKHIDRVSLK